MEELEDLTIMDESLTQLASPLEILPRDLMWKVIKYTPRSVAQLRLVAYFISNYVILPTFQTSHTIKSCVDEYSLLRTRVDLVEELTIYCLAPEYSVVLHRNVLN